jgi:threonine synthase
MILYSTEHKSPNVSLEEAIFRGLPPDNGLYMPTEINPLPASFFETIQDRTLPEIAIAVCENLLGDSLSSAEIKKIIDDFRGAYRLFRTGDGSVGIIPRAIDGV